MSDGAEMADDSTAGQESQPKKGPGKLLLIVVLLVGLGGGAAAGGVFLGPLVGERLAAAPSDGDEDGGRAPADEGHGAGSDEGTDHEGGGGGGEAVSELVLIENLVVNPARSGGSRILLANVAIQPVRQDLIEPIGAMDTQLRDALLRTFARKTVDELSDLGQRDALLGELTIAIEEVVGPGTVARLYLPQFVIQ